MLRETTRGDEEVKKIELAPLTKKHHAWIATVFCLLYLGSNYATYLSFDYTSVGSASILLSTCGFFTLLFGRIVGIEQLSLTRILAVLISVGGVLLLGIPEFRDSRTRALGNLIALTAAFLYGVYSTYLKRIAIDESRLNMTLLFGLSGLYTLLFLWPVFGILHLTGYETLEMPSATTAVHIAINVIVGGLIPNYLWNVAYIGTSPLMVAIGLSFNIPLTLIVEKMRGQPMEPHRIGSAVCVVLGFLILNLSTIYPQIDLFGENFLKSLGLSRSKKVQSIQEQSAKSSSI